MKNLFLLAVFSLGLLSACDRTEEAQEFSEIEMLKVTEQDTQELGDAEEEVNSAGEVSHIEQATEEKVAWAESNSAVLEKDSTGDYEAENVFDGDLSTAWCPAPVDYSQDGPFAGGLTLNFTQSPAGKTMNIFPGFARDETIYWENNRIKTLVIPNLPSPALEDAFLFELKDQYGFQSIVLPQDIKNMIMLFPQELYPGSKYNDTCIAEIQLVD